MSRAIEGTGPDCLSMRGLQLHAMLARVSLQHPAQRSARGFKTRPYTFEFKTRQVEIICASMSGALGSVGGFCVGHSEVRSSGTQAAALCSAPRPRAAHPWPLPCTCAQRASLRSNSLARAVPHKTPQVCDHQRLCGQGYCFSASLPPYLATAAIEALRILGTPDGQARAAAVRAAAAELRGLLSDVPTLRLAGAAAGPGAASPVLHLHLAPEVESALGGRAAASAALQRVADAALARSGVFVALPRYSALDEAAPRPSIKLVANAALAEAGRAAAVAAAVREAAAGALGGAPPAKGRR